MKRLRIIGMACVALAISANASYEWRGATGEWSDSAANWWDGSVLVPWTAGSYAYMPVAGSGVATDLVIASEGVTASTYQQRPGSVYSLSGGPLAASTFSMESSSGANPAVLAINNAVSANALDENGNSDCLDYPAQIDLSSMTLKVNDLSKLNRTKRYKIATLNGGIVNNALFKSTNLPATWDVRYNATSHELTIVPVKGMKFNVR